MSTPLNPEQLEQALSTLPGWALDGSRLKKTFEFGGFAEAISFLMRIAFSAERLDHHPELHNVYNRVDVSLCTHDAGDRVTEKDLALAREIQGFSWVK
jgi:4a-hydroxytetrahydrobiopterin dehydratase